MKHSIKRQLAVVFIGLTILTIASCLLINSTLLETFYVNNKQHALMEVYGKINALDVLDSPDQEIPEETEIELMNLCSKYNISLLVLNGESQTVLATMHDSDMLKQQLLDNIFFTDQHRKRVKILKQTERYTIQSSFDPRLHTGFIEMWGFLDNGNLFLFRTGREGIRDSVAIANRFLIYVGFLAVLVSGIIIWFVSKKITAPLLCLADISDRMRHLDFDAKYTVGKRKNEIDVLGENINQLSETLEHTISELKTANNELQKDVEKKEQIDEMRKEFLSNVSHELKTPIALIQGYAEGLKEGIREDGESKDFYCDVIMDEAGKMNVMVNKLLTLNQLEFGNDVVSMERFDLMELLRTFMESMELLTKQSGITVRLDGQESCYVWADEFKTEEMIRNYFSNAMNFCKGEKVIHVKTTILGGKVRVSVFNTGDPIPEEAVPHLWEKFYKVDKARTREYGGSGVGLSIVKAIAESMNQEYGVINYENGVEFWFTLELQ